MCQYQFMHCEDVTNKSLSVEHVLHIVYLGGGLDIPKHYTLHTYKYMSCTHAYMLKMHVCQNLC